ncbi:MAG: LssY C-terminal domain-containing protein [Bryobacteraceae bacterium]
MVVLSVSLSLLAFSQSTQIDVKAGEVWTDTNLDVAAGETIRITGSGELQYAGAKSAATPQGMSRGFKDMVRTLPVNAAGRGALIAKVGESVPFLVGNKWEGKVPISGRLFVGINQGSNDKPEGSYKASIDRVAAAPPPVDVEKLNLPKLSQDQLDSIPIRVQDANGTPGDRVNFVVVGSEARMKDSLKGGGWVIVDRDKKAAVLIAGLSIIQKGAYVTMPMSELMLFNRVQDYGWAMADPLKVVAARHHFRIWKAPFDLNGMTVWAGAGTHDIGFDKDQRTGGVTHKIDPDTDGEREYIGKTMQSSGLVAKLDYMTAKNTFTTGKTAHGEEFHTDGRTLIIYLLPDSVQR